MKYVELVKAAFFVTAGCGLSSAFWVQDVGDRAGCIFLAVFASFIAISIDWMEG